MSSYKHDWKSIEPRCSGRWFELLESFGVSTRKVNKNGPCPNCGGVDRAHYFERDGRIMLYCRHGCGNSGDGNCVSTPEFLLQEHNRWSFPEMVRAIADYLGVTPEAPVQHSGGRASTSIVFPDCHRSNPDKASSDLDRAITSESHPLFAQEHTWSPSHCLTIGNTLALPIINGAGELVNVAAIAPNYKIFWSAGAPSFGAFAVIPARQTAIRRILCIDYFDGWRIWWKLRGDCEIRCTISPEVFIHATRKMRDMFDAVAVDEEDAEEYREMGLEVVVLPKA